MKNRIRASLCQYREASHEVAETSLTISRMSASLYATCMQCYARRFESLRSSLNRCSDRCEIDAGRQVSAAHEREKFKGRSCCTRKEPSKTSKSQTCLFPKTHCMNSW